jgi:hypothetical protein
MQYFDNVLSEEDYEYVLNRTMRGDGWTFSGHSVNPEDYVFWYMELINDPFFHDRFLPRINELTGKNYEIDRVYANGQTHGLPGNIHTDVDPNVYMPEAYKTFCYYVNPVWDVRWSGHTFIMKPDGVADSVYPRKNAGIIFPSTWQHFAAEVSRYCKELRVTVAFKLKESM